MSQAGPPQGARHRSALREACPTSAAAPGPQAPHAGALRGPALYVGSVMHQRLRPLRHRLAYRVYSMLVDIDRLHELDRLRWCSVGRFNLFALHPRDYGDGQATDGAGLRACIDGHLRRAGLPTGGAIHLLTMPRLLGYAFHPINVWFCATPEGRLQAMVYEVNNTFGQRHTYLVAVDGDAAIVRQRCDKHLYVSPFLGMALHYRFHIEPPRERLSVGVSVHDDAGAAVLNARFDAQRRELTDAALLRVFATHPLLTLKVIAGIHLEALLLWLKGARLQRRPPPPAEALTIVRHGTPGPS